MKLSRFAVVTVAVTFALLLVGGLVHGTGSSLACPDWPLCYGQFFPKMERGVEYEHTHRLVAGAVALLTLALSVLVFRDERYRSLRPLAVAAPIMVLVQAVLGGVTVLLKLPLIVTLAHLTLSMCFFAVLVVIAVRAQGIERRTLAEPSGLRTFVAVVGFAILAQIVLGGIVRHRMAGLACMDIPFCYGKVWPPESSSSLGERLHMLHRFWGCVVAVLVFWQARLVARRSRDLPEGPGLRRLALAAPVLVVVQIVLGVLSVTSLLHLHTVTAHLGVAALLLASLVSTWTLLRAPRTAPESLVRPTESESADAPVAA